MLTDQQIKKIEIEWHTAVNGPEPEPGFRYAMLRAHIPALIATIRELQTQVSLRSGEAKWQQERANKEKARAEAAEAERDRLLDQHKDKAHE